MDRHHKSPLLVGVSVTLALMALAGCRPSGDADVQRGLALYEARQFDEAIPMFEKGLEQPLSAYSRSDILTTIGNCHYELDELDKTLTFHDQALAEDPENERAHVNMGIVFRLQGEYERAEACYRQAMKLAPEYAELHGSMGTLAIVQGKFDEAIGHLERSIELDALHPVAHSNLAVAYASVGRFDEADAELQKAISLGYHQPDVIQERIDGLRESAAENESP